VIFPYVLLWLLLANCIVFSTVFCFVAARD